jgi:hypothetical protein
MEHKLSDKEQVMFDKEQVLSDKKYVLNDRRQGPKIGGTDIRFRKKNM